MATFAINAATRKAQATANGSTTQFAFSFSINVEADIAVFVGTTLKTISTHYTVSITSSTGAGSITFTSGNTPTNGQIVTLMSKTALARASVYTSGGTINATSLETDFDTNMMLFQQQDERLDRVISAPVDDATSINMTLPNKDARKGKVLGFNSSSGNPEATAQVTGAAVNVSTVSVGGSATATVAVSSGTATFALGIPTGATGATGPAGGGLAQLVADTSPELGGNLDVLAKDIVSSSNRPIDLAPNGTGIVVIHGNTAASATNDGSIKLNCSSNSHGQIIKAQPHSATVTNTMTLPAGASSTLVSLVSTDTLTNKTLTSPKVNGSVAVTATGTELNYTDVTTLGLSQASKAVTADANGVITLDNGFSEEYGAVTSSSNAIAINLRTANNFSHTLTENTTISFANPAASGKVSAFTLKVIQASSAKSITWHSSIKWAGDSAPTLSTGNGNVDVFCGYTVDAGTTYYMFTAGQVMS